MNRSGRWVPWFLSHRFPPRESRRVVWIVLLSYLIMLIELISDTKNSRHYRTDMAGAYWMWKNGQALPPPFLTIWFSVIYELFNIIDILTCANIKQLLIRYGLIIENWGNYKMIYPNSLSGIVNQSQGRSNPHISCDWYLCPWACQTSAGWNSRRWFRSADSSHRHIQRVNNGDG